MDPLTALGLGANILQLIDSGTKIVKAFREVVQAGNTRDNRFYLHIAEDLRSTVSDIAKSRPDADVDEATDALVALANECKQEAITLISKINKYTLDRDERSAKTLARSVAKITWNRPEIDVLERRLATFRQLLSLRILAAVNSKTTKQSTQIVEVLSLTQSINSSVGAIAAVLRDEKGTHRTILSTQQRPKTYDSTTATSIVYTNAAPKDSSHLRHDPESILSSTASNIASKTAFNFYEISQIILDSLWFRFVTTREDIIDPAFRKTYEWAFSEHPQSNNRKHSGLRRWLRAGQGCYWVNGKAGSGKSTFMKFVSSHTLLDEQLRTWSHGSPLLRASFFFWRAGQDSLQRSQDGLLRSLLFQMLNRRRELITVCFPELYRHLSLQPPNSMMESIAHSSEDLRLAFLRLSRHNLSGTKLFFMIDGLDEFVGDQRRLVNLIEKAASSTNVKLLISSRPIPLFVQAFSTCPNLRLQDLTYDDILHYTTEMLRPDATLTMMDMLDNGFSDLLIDNIASKASGVFLWVIIVVRETLDGLANHDTKEQLLDTLEKLPIDLEELYAYMFDSMNDAYKMEASMIFQLYMRSRKVQFEHPLTALQLYLASTKDPKECYEQGSAILSVEEQHACVGVVEGRLRSRCCGLLEVQDMRDIMHVSIKHVEFLHRTVMEFLHQATIWSQLTSWSSREWPLDEMLLSSCIQELRQEVSGPNKVIPIHSPSASGGHLDIFDARIVQAFEYSWSVRHSDTNAAKLYMSALYNVHRLSPRLSQPDDQRQLFQRSIKSAVTMDYDPDAAVDDFLMCAASYGLVDICDSRLLATFHDPSFGSLVLMNNLVSLCCPADHFMEEQVLAGISGLLDLGIDPNKPVTIESRSMSSNWISNRLSALLNSMSDKGNIYGLPRAYGNAISPWIFWLSCLLIKADLVKKRPILYMDILEKMILAGGNLKCVINFGTGTICDVLILDFLNNLQDKCGKKGLDIEVRCSRLRKAMGASACGTDTSLDIVEEKHSSAIGLRTKFKRVLTFSKTKRK